MLFFSANDDDDAVKLLEPKVIIRSRAGLGGSLANTRKLSTERRDALFKTACIDLTT